GRPLYFREPGPGILFAATPPVDLDCRLAPADLPPGWLTAFPSGEEIIEKAISLKPWYARKDADKRLLLRRDCEYELFRSIEEATVLSVITTGFTSVDTFINYANSVANRRKSRAGR